MTNNQPPCYICGHSYHQHTDPSADLFAGIICEEKLAEMDNGMGWLLCTCHGYQMPLPPPSLWDRIKGWFQ